MLKLVDRCSRVIGYILVWRSAQRGLAEEGFRSAFIRNGGATLRKALLAALAHLPGWQARLIHLGSLADQVVELDALLGNQACLPAGNSPPISASP